MLAMDHVLAYFLLCVGTSSEDWSVIMKLHLSLNVRRNISFTNLFKYYGFGGGGVMSSSANPKIAGSSPAWVVS
jgi:hypothetical protein